MLCCCLCSGEGVPSPADGEAERVGDREKSQGENLSSPHSPQTTGELQSVHCYSNTGAPRSLSLNLYMYLLQILLKITNFAKQFASFHSVQEYNRDHRLYQHQLDMERAEQLKRPTEDLLVSDLVSFPPLVKLGWLKLPSAAFADLLMVFQFVHSFREFLELEVAPGLPSLFSSLHNHGVEVVGQLFVQLLRAVLFDPGSNALTTAGETEREKSLKK